MTRPDVDLARASVFLDFDGTISTADVGMHLLDRAGSPEWWELHERFERGEIGSRECISKQWALVSGDEATLRAIAAEVPLDPGFVPLVDALRDAGAELDRGLGRLRLLRARRVRAPGSRRAHQRGRLHHRRVAFPVPRRRLRVAACGTCKQAPIRAARARGRTTVLIGDGASDRQAALLADVVFAKGPLASWCAGAAVGCTPFDGLDDVRRALCP